MASEAGGLREKGATEGTEKAVLERTMAVQEREKALKERVGALKELEACDAALAMAKITGEAEEIDDAKRRRAVALAALEAAASALTSASARLQSLSRPTVATKGMRNSVRPCTLIRHGSPSA